MIEKQCCVCGVVFNNNQGGFYLMEEIKDIYSIGNHKVICSKCGEKANAFVNYWGKKKERDLKDLNLFLLNGVLPQREFKELMNAGYSEIRR